MSGPGAGKATQRRYAAQASQSGVCLRTMGVLATGGGASGTHFLALRSRVISSISVEWTCESLRAQIGTVFTSPG